MEEDRRVLRSGRVTGPPGQLVREKENEENKGCEESKESTTSAPSRRFSARLRSMPAGPALQVDRPLPARSYAQPFAVSSPARPLAPRQATFPGMASASPPSGDPSSRPSHTPMAFGNHSQRPANFLPPHGLGSLNGPAFIHNGHPFGNTGVPRTPTGPFIPHSATNTSTRPSGGPMAFSPPFPHGLGRSYQARMRSYMGLGPPPAHPQAQSQGQAQPPVQPYRMPGSMIGAMRYPIAHGQNPTGQLQNQYNSPAPQNPAVSPPFVYNSPTPYGRGFPAGFQTTPIHQIRTMPQRGGDTTIPASTAPRFPGAFYPPQQASPSGNVSAMPLHDPFAPASPAAGRGAIGSGPEMYTFSTFAPSYDYRGLQAQSSPARRVSTPSHSHNGLQVQSSPAQHRPTPSRYQGLQAQLPSARHMPTPSASAPKAPPAPKITEAKDATRAPKATKASAPTATHALASEVVNAPAPAVANAPALGVGAAPKATKTKDTTKTATPTKADKGLSHIHPQATRSTESLALLKPVPQRAAFTEKKALKKYVAAHAQPNTVLPKAQEPDHREATSTDPEGNGQFLDLLDTSGLSFPTYQATRQPNPNSASLGAIDPYGNALWQDMFDELVGVPQSNKLALLGAWPGSSGQEKQKSPHKQEKGLDDRLDNPHFDMARLPDDVQDGIVGALSAPAVKRTPSSKQGMEGMASAFDMVHDEPLSPFTAPEDSDAEDAESMADFKKNFTNALKKMMYVSGETGEPSAETTGIIEEIVRQQVIELLRNCTELAARRGSRSITINDLIFQIRHDTPKVSRLRTFLSWKDVRKNVKDSDDKAGDAELAAAEDPVGGVVAGGPVDDAAKKNKKAKVGLPWEPSSFFNQEVPEREDEEDEEEEEMNYITLQRLRKADERTKAMTKEEYVTWSEFRQASFTYRKGKRFREWAGFSTITDSKPSDDIVDILGFLTFEMVQTLTEEGLKIKDHEDLLKERTGENAGTKKRKLAQGLFDPPSEGRTPVEPRHIQEGFRRLQAHPKKSRAMLNGTRIQQRSNLRLI